jgi:hypothetical protein
MMDNIIYTCMYLLQRKECLSVDVVIYSAYVVLNLKAKFFERFIFWIDA